MSRTFKRICSRGFIIHFVYHFIIAYLSSLSITYFIFHNSPKESLIENIVIAIFVAFFGRLLFYRHEEGIVK
jgi:hypothetical protein